MPPPPPLHQSAAVPESGFGNIGSLQRASFSPSITGEGPLNANEEAPSIIPSRRRRVDSIDPQPSPKRLKPADSFHPAPVVVSNAAMISSPVHQQEPRPVARKLVIKNRRTNPGTHELDRYFASTWAELDEAVDAILQGRDVEISLNRVYRGVEDLCRNGKAEVVYARLVEKVEQRVMNVELAYLKSLGDGDSVEVLRGVIKVWNTWNEKSKLIRSTFSYLDRRFLLKSKNLPLLNDMLIQQFRKMLFKLNNELSPPASPGDIAIAGINKLVSLDRFSYDFDKKLMREAIMMLHVLSSFIRRFDPCFIRESRAFFKEFAERRSMLQLKEYITDCRDLLEREKERCSRFFFDSSTKRQLITFFHQILVKDYMDRLLDKESLFKLIDEEEVVTLQSLYHLLSLSGIQRNLINPWSLYILKTGTEIVKDVAHGDDMVPRLLLLRRSLDTIIRDSFEGDEEFQRALRDRFDDFMNDRKTAEVWESGTSKIGEMIAKYMDGLLRGGLKAVPEKLRSSERDLQEAQRSGAASTADEDAELDRQLDQALELFRHIEGKDAFEAFYKRGLARRLLLDRSASQDAERNMLAKLRGQCGGHFTHNLEQMFKDKDLAKDEMENYRQAITTKGERAPFDLQVMILSAAAWPPYPDVRPNLPPEINAQIEKFDIHYRTKHTGRVLTWKHSLAHCVIKAHFPKGTKELAVSIFQAVVLLLFNDTPAVQDGKEILSYEQISRATGLTGQELDRTLQSLACGKARVLTKHPKSKDVKPTDTFSVNLAFSDPKYRVKINQIQMRESREENRATHDKVVRDRRLETQAAIVRIMKSRQTMSHALLVAEVIEMTRKRGSVDAAEIKKEIESLIEKDYLEREGNSYAYLA